MFYEAELFFVRQVLERFHVPSVVVETEKFDLSEIDGVLELMLGEEIKGKTFADLFPSPEPNTIYKVSDVFFCNYIYFLLPDNGKETLFLIGPYTMGNNTPQAIMEKGEQLGLSLKNIKQLEFYLGSVPAVQDERAIFTLLDTLGEYMWGLEGFHIIDVKGERLGEYKLGAVRQESQPEDTALKMKIMEDRYRYENELMDAVTHGRLNKVEIMLSNFSQLSFERRSKDDLRNIKNYCIIMNTLLRKAAEQGGVHPMYIDSVSGEFARQIEALPSVSAASSFMQEIFRKYCMLVRRKSVQSYSPLVRRAILCIDADLTADLTLKRLSALNGVSESYFSNLFRTETGKTLTAYVNGKRIEQAKKLLRTTTLQVQTVAQHCGILDVQYFTKIFKRETGKTPKEYREAAI